MRIAIIGTGAIGSLLAESLAYRVGEDILCVVASEAHATNIRENGIKIRHLEKNIKAVDEEKIIGIDAVTDTNKEKPADIVFVAVKAPMTEPAVIQHRALFGAETIAVSLQNGYGNAEALERVVSPESIVIGTTAQAAYIDKEGTVIHAGSGATVVGAAMPDSRRGRKAADKVAELLTDCGFEVGVTEDAKDAVFRKLFINVGINALCAVNGIKNGALLESMELMDASRQLVREAVEAINAAEGRSYEAAEIEAAVAATLQATAENKCSMLQDIERGRTTEIRSINGAIVRMAEGIGMCAPCNSDIVETIEKLQVEARQNDLKPAPI